MVTDLLSRAVCKTMTWNFRMWGFGEAIALRGLLEAGTLLGDAEPRGFVHGLLRGWIGRGAARSPEDHVAPGRELIVFHQQTGDPQFLDIARRLAALHESFPAAPSGARRHRPDQPGWRGQIWVDSLDVDAPFLARLAWATGEDRYYDLAAAEALGYCRELQDETSGLFIHGNETHCGPNGGWWARGNGWALLGLVDTLTVLPGAHPSWNELHQRLGAQVAGLAGVQQEGGLWRTLLDHDEAYLESTLAVMAAVALREAFDHDLLDRGTFGAMEARARAAVRELIDDDGALGLVSDATPIGQSRVYLTRPFGTFPWGQGPLLLMLCQDLS
jgi:unsaturated rhamnogalacturonyl hydrolase